MVEAIFTEGSGLWPLCFLLVSFLVWLQLRSDVRPIFIGVVKGLTVTAQSNALYFGMLILVGAQIAFGAMTDEARLLGFAKLAACAKVISLTCGGVLAFMIRPPANSFSGEIKTPVIQPPAKEL